MERSWTHLARCCEYMQQLERLLLESYRDKISNVRATKKPRKKD
jgi:hypothetical protein